MKQKYAKIRFRSASLDLIRQANAVLEAYKEKGYRLTVRSLYYRLVAQDIIENSVRSYKRLTSLVNDARLAGMLDWDVIEDRTREFLSVQTWRSPKSILRGAANGYTEDKWLHQENKVFMIVEKDALMGILEGICARYQIPLMAARGYPSATVLREFALGGMARASAAGKAIHIFHLGDHDPSGIDMTRDLQERIGLFFDYGDVTFERIALNLDQVEELNPPENPAKQTDSRFEQYAARFGQSSWELDALPPEYMHDLIDSKVGKLIDDDQWEYDTMWIEHYRDVLSEFADTFKE